MLFLSPRIRRLIDMAIDEDAVGFDVASGVLFDQDAIDARLVAKQRLTVAGQDVVEAVFGRIDPQISCRWDVADADAVDAGQRIGRVAGRAAAVLRGERIALNFLQRMSAIATKTARYVAALGATDTRIVDTRKTLPGWRELDKYAVRCGGGANHRFNLSGGVMLKDNHIAAANGDIGAAVERVRQRAPLTLKVEVETTTPAEIDRALAAGADVIMLDNMSTDEMVEAIAQIRGHAGSNQVAIEASGNITVDRLPDIADIGLDYISSGALTHSVAAADISMKF